MNLELGGMDAFLPLGFDAMKRPASDVEKWARNEGVVDALPGWLKEVRASPTVWDTIRHDVTKIENAMGEKTDQWKIWLYYLDKHACGDTQLPAYKLSRFTSEEDLLKLASYRVARFASTVLEMVGDTASVYGASQQQFAVGSIGLAVSAATRIANGYLDNKSGSHVMDMIDHIFSDVVINKRAMDALGSLLSDMGIDRSLLYDAGREGYGMELNRVRDDIFRARVEPVLIGSALIAAGNPWGGLLVGGLGSLAIPIGNYVHEYELKEKKPAGRWATSAGVSEFAKTLGDLHVRMVTGLRFIGEAPAILKIFFVNQIGAFMGAEMGTSNLSGTLSTQRTRASMAESVDAIQKLLSVLESDASPILTNWSLPKHIAGEIDREGEHSVGTDGLQLEHFKPMYGSHPERGFSARFRAGEVIRIYGESGIGKSVFLDGIAHIFNHTGNVALIENGNPVNIHTFSADERKMKIVSISMENLGAKGDRVMDYFQEFVRLMALHPQVGNQDEHRDALNRILEGLSNSDRDLLLQSSYDHLGMGAKNSLAPRAVRERAQKFLEVKGAIINTLLGQYFPHRDVSTESQFSTLSRGMKQRVVNAVARGYLTYLNPSVMILDEMVEGLDDVNVDVLLRDFDILMRGQNKPPVVLWVAHNRNDKVAASFGRRYREFDLRSGLYEEEKRDRVKLSLLEETSANPIGPDDVRKMAVWFGRAKAFVSLCSAYDNEALGRYLEHVKRWTENRQEEKFITRQLEYMTSRCGFSVDIDQLFEALLDIGSAIEDPKAHDTVHWARELFTYSVYQLPVHFWFTIDTMCGLFGPRSPGDGYRFLVDGVDRWDRLAAAGFIDGDRMTMDFDPRLALCNALQNFVLDYIHAPETFWPVYRKILESTLLEMNFFGKFQNGLWDQEYPVLGKLRERGHKFIDDLEKMLLRQKPSRILETNISKKHVRMMEVFQQVVG